MQNIQVYVHNLAKMMVDGTFKGGVELSYGLKEGGVGLPEDSNRLIPQDIIDYVSQQAEKVINGEIKVPKNEEEYNALMK